MKKCKKTFGEKRLLTTSQSSLQCIVCIHICSTEVQTPEVAKITKMEFFWPSQCCGYVLLFLPFPWLDSKHRVILSATHSMGEGYMVMTYMDNTQVARIPLR